MTLSRTSLRAISLYALPEVCLASPLCPCHAGCPKSEGLLATLVLPQQWLNPTQEDMDSLIKQGKAAEKAIE